MHQPIGMAADKLKMESIGSTYPQLEWCHIGDSASLVSVHSKLKME